MPSLRLACFVFLLAAGAASAYEAGSAQRKIKPASAKYNWRGDNNQSLSTTVWYPAAAHPAGSKPAPLATGPSRFPLVLLSHGTGGSAGMLEWLGAHLAREGFIAAAVNHPGNNALSPYTPQGFFFWGERATDLSQVLTSLLADAQFGSRIDRSRIGAAGFSLGGYTVLELAGAIGSLARYKSFCASPEADALCRDVPEFPGLLKAMDDLAETDEFRAYAKSAAKSRRDPRIRAVFAIAPALGPAFDPADLRKIAVPVKIVSGAADTIVPPDSGARRLAPAIPGATLTIYPGAIGHYTFLATCGAVSKQPPAVFCQDNPGVDRDAVHRKTADEAVAFFRSRL